MKGFNRDSGIFALDVGGAFIKTAYLPAKGRAVRKTTAFELWKHPEKLKDELRKLKPRRGKYLCALTMTGELCDCFKNRREGVRRISESARQALGETFVYGLRSGLLGAREAAANYKEVASANWALPPILIGRTEKDFLLLDIGSTTTDLTPVRAGRVANKGFSDFERLKRGELVYTGYLRTPVQFLIQPAIIRGRELPLSSENFCVVGDAHLALGNIFPKQYNSPTPDGGPKTVAASLNRLSRCLMADDREVSKGDLLELARQITAAQLKKIGTAAEKFGLPVIAIGNGSFMLEGAFESRKLERHRSAPKYSGLDPSLALALLIRDGEFGI